MWVEKDTAHGTWSYEEFLQHLDDYIDMCKGFVHEFDEELALMESMGAEE